MRRFGFHLLLVSAFLLIFLVLNTVHFLLLPVHVVLYDALADAVAAGGVLGLVLIASPKLRELAGAAEAGLCVVIGFLLAVIYCITVPAIIDRSLSVYFLEKLVQRGGAIRQSAWDGILKNEFMVEHRIVDIRLTEQVNSGTVTIRDGCVRVTPRGEAIARFTRFYRQNLLPKQREIMGQLTDDLTDPFRRSAAPTAGEACDRG